MMTIITSQLRELFIQAADIIGAYVVEIIYKFAIELLIWFYESYNAGLNTAFFDHSVVSGLLGFFEVVGAVVLVIGFVKAVVTETERQLHGEGFTLGQRALDFLKAFGLLLFCRPVVLGSHNFMISMADLITSNLTVDTLSLKEMYLKQAEVQSFMNVATAQFIYGALLLIIAVICTVLIWFTIVRQYAILVVQIFTGYLYVYDVAAGNSNAIGEWGRDMLGARLSFSLHLVFYKIGMYLFADGISRVDLAQANIAIVFLLGASMVPQILKRWGYANQTGNGAIGRFVGGVAQSATSAASTVIGVVT